MNCQTLQPDLVAFHFGVIAEPRRAEVEVHLSSCAACLGEYLALKRDVETGEGEARPSVSARARLRSSVADELGVREPKVGWAWWERPFAFGFAGAAVLFAMFATHLVATGAAAPPHALADAAQTRSAP